MQQATISAVVETALAKIGIATNVDIYRFDNIVELFEEALVRHGARKAYKSWL